VAVSVWICILYWPNPGYPSSPKEQAPKEALEALKEKRELGF